ncbi:MAG: response regulator [Desulfobulbaceae bacterium]|nr:MAG: response regulator [Desulfobulbaceae bacterium]
MKAEAKPINNAEQVRLPSITIRLITGLALAVTLFSTIVFALLYQYISDREKTGLEKKADEYIESLAQSLELPLWNFDKAAVTTIGKATSQNEIVVKLEVSSTHPGAPDSILYRYNEAFEESSLIIRKGAVIHEGMVIGSVALALTLRSYEQNVRQMILIFGTTTAVTLVAIILATGVLIRVFLQRPLATLNTIVEAYRNGDYAYINRKIPYREFVIFENVLVEMGRTIELNLHELQRAEQKYRSIFENSVEGIFQTKPSGQVVSANPAMARMLGFDDPQELMETISDVAAQCYVDPEMRKEFLELLEAQGEVNQFQLKLRKKDDSIIWAELSARAMREPSGEISMIEGVITDITHQKAVEKERKKIEHQLQQSQRIEALGNLTGGIAHDFNNLLQVISGYIQLLLLKCTKTCDHYDHLEKIELTVSRSSELVKRLLTFSRHVDTNFQPVSVNDIILSTVRLMERTVPKMVRINLKLSEGLPPIQADQLQVEQVLINLITNATDAMGEAHGSIEIETIVYSWEQNSEQGNSAESSQLVEPGDYVQINVSDNGQGMDENTRQHIFDPFFSTKSVDRGTGLGLSTVYGIIKGHKGYIQCQSAPGLGATFEILLPVSRSDTSAENGIEPQKSGLLPKGEETILIVDDENEILETAEGLLAYLGYNCLKAESGEAALEVFAQKKGQISLVLIDLNMPGMGGEKCIGELQRIEPQAKILISSGYASHKFSHHSKEFGVEGFIQKPYQLETLAQKVRLVLDQNG